jgi:hypothetical protein
MRGSEVLICIAKRSEVLQHIDGLRKKLSNIIRRHTVNMKLLLIYTLLLLHSYIFLGSIYINACMVVFLFNTVINVFYYYVYVFLLYVYISSSCHGEIFGYPDWDFPCFFLSSKANARVEPAKMGHGPHTSRFLCCSMYCLLCVGLCILCA